MRTGMVVMVSFLLGAALISGSVEALPIPLEQLDARWTPVAADDVQITALRLTIVPSAGQGHEDVLWTVDESFVLRNYGAADQVLTLGIPNLWSAFDPLTSSRAEDFWAEAEVNGRPVSTEVTSLLMNPAWPSVDVRTVKRFEVRVATGESIHVRLQFAMPAEHLGSGELGLSYPFYLARQYDGPIEFGVITLRWTDQMFAFRSNLSAYSLYSDRAEWFVRAFEPGGSFQVQFLPRTSVFSAIAAEIGCPMPWEVMDRIADGSIAELREMLEPYPTDTLGVCAALPGALRGSLADAVAGGLRELRLEQFRSLGGISGELFTEDPGYQESDLTDTEAVYVRFLRQEVATRR